MKVFLVTLLAIIITPLIFAYFQNAKYEGKLKPSLLSQVHEILSSKKVEGVEVSIEKLDVSVSGVAGSKEAVNDIKQSITELGDGAVRVSASGYMIQVYGEADVQKEKGKLFLAGEMSDPSAFLGKLNAGDLGSLGEVKTSSELDLDSVYRDSSAIGNSQLPEWTARYLSLKGDRGYKLSASDNKIRPYGNVTPRLRQELTASAENVGLVVDSSGFDIIDPSPAKLTFSNTGGESSLSGKVPRGFDSTVLFKATKISVEEDDFTDLHPSVSAPAFHKWVGSYFNAKGERGIKIAHDEVSLSGPGTFTLRKKWLGELTSQGLKPTSQLKIYPSEYHYPNYKLESKLDAGAQKSLRDAFALNQVFFDSGSSDVREDQLPKVDALAAAIATAGKDVKFVIGGHADSTGHAEFNRQLSKKRAAAVVKALAEKEISDQRFTVVSFGAAKSSGAGSNESDRKVEIRIK